MLPNRQAEQIGTKDFSHLSLLPLGQHLPPTAYQQYIILLYRVLEKYWNPT